MHDNEKLSGEEMVESIIEGRYKTKSGIDVMDSGEIEEKYEDTLRNKEDCKAFKNHEKYLIDEYLPYVRAQKGIWIQEDKVSISMQQMGLEHINNAKRKIDKDIKENEHNLSATTIKKMKSKKIELGKAFKEKIK